MLKQAINNTNIKVLNKVDFSILKTNCLNLFILYTPFITRALAPKKELILL